MPAPLSSLLEVAVPQHGLFTLEQAEKHGVSAAHVRKLAGRGVVERRAQGLYRVSAIPVDERTEYMEAVLWANGEGVIASESALVLWDLADVNPRRIHLVVPHYVPRRAERNRYHVHRARLASGDRDEVDGIAVVAPAVAIAQAVEFGTAGDMIEQAIRRAQARDHFGPRVAARLLVSLDERGSGRSE